MKKLEMEFIKFFVEIKYPVGTHDLQLDMCFDYYNGLCHQFIHNSRRNSTYFLGAWIDYYLYMPIHASPSRSFSRLTRKTS